MGQWHVDRPPGRAGSPAWNAVRWMLLAAVLAGLFGMHVLTDGDDASVHGDLAPVPVAAQPSSGGHVMPGRPPEAPTAFDTNGRAVNAWSGAAVSGAPNGGLGAAGHGMAQCVLFLLTVGSALLLALLASRWPAMTRGVLAVVTATRGELRRRGPPGSHAPARLRPVRDPDLEQPTPPAVPSGTAPGSRLPNFPSGSTLKGAP